MSKQKRNTILFIVVLYLLTWAGGWVSYSGGIEARARLKLQLASKGDQCGPQ